LAYLLSPVRMRLNMSRLSIALALVIVAVLRANDAPQNDPKQRLSRLQPLVGAWRGVGQPQRGSTKDSWVEEADWAWSFTGANPALIAELPKAKYFRQLRLSAGSLDREYVLTATPAAGGETVRYAGRLDDQDQLILTAEQPRDDLPRRLSFRFVAGGDRLLLLLEKKSPSSDQLTRLAEVGYTRQGSGFGKIVTQRECVVTGGLGTIEVTHAGKTYYVCCTGCRDYFNENAEKVLAEYAARKAEKK
jgi:hypothetical protein